MSFEFNTVLMNMMKLLLTKLFMKTIGSVVFGLLWWLYMSDECSYSTWSILPCPKLVWYNFWKTWTVFFGRVYFSEVRFSLLSKNSLVILLVIGNPQPTVAVIATTVHRNSITLSKSDMLHGPIVIIKSIVFVNLLRLLNVFFLFELSEFFFKKSWN